MPKLLTLLLSFALSCGLSAQELYTVRVGSFQDVKAADFPTLTDLGFVYGAPRENQVTDVFLGNYTSEAAAQSAAARAVQLGFRNAQAFALPIASGQNVAVIQMGLYGKGRPVDWDQLGKAGDLYVESVDGVRKIVTGIYPGTAAAQAALAGIRSLGYADAFVKQINNVRLIPVRTFETGIKKDLIPLNLNNQAQSKGEPTPAAYGGSVVAPTPAPVTTPVATTGALPTINGREKRTSAADLQRVLKEKGYYEGSIDGLYGPGTTSSFERAWNDLPEVRKYRTLADNLFAPQNPNRDVVSQWPAAAVLLTIVEDIAADQQNVERARQLAQQRQQLYSAGQSLTPAAASRVRAWNATVWENLTEWAREDPLHAQIFSALRLAYYQTQVRLENMYQARGLSNQQSRDLSLAMLQNLTGAQLDRFLAR